MSASNIQVAIKARPLLKKEKENKLSNQWKIINNSIQLADSQSEPFYFDHIFDEGTTNRQIFNTVAKPIVDAALRGFNGTIFAYGQTSSGKTYAMVGDDQNPGVMIMAVQEIFKEIEKATDRAFLLRVGYIEIYNEKIFDLLNKKNQDLKIHETATGEVNVNCTDFIITCEQDLIEHLNTGNKTRKISETNMNDRSSRSHAIFRIIIESREFDKTSDETAVQISHLNLVDLAGSERADQSGATGFRLKEGCHINKSLLSLSCVINKLSENESDKFINYRDSKLTRILQASLGGNALTAIICTIKTTVIEETNSTLSFAMRAKCIKNKPHKNEVLSDAAMMKRLAKEISRLENELKVEKNKNSKITIMQIERKIKDVELKIVHSHAVGTDRKESRRRTWCPSSNTLPSTNKNVFEDINEDMVKIESNSDISPPPMFLTPLITLRDNFQNPVPEETYIPGEEIQFSQSDFDQFDIGVRTPVMFKRSQEKMILTPVDDIKIRYETLKQDFDDLEMFTKLEKDSNIELRNANEKIAQLEQERRKYLEFIDENHGMEIKLERSKQRCLELESRISELNENANVFESKEQGYQIKLNEYANQVKSLLMASKDIESIEFQYEKSKQISKCREEDHLGVIKERDMEISNLKKQHQNTPLSTEEAYVDTIVASESKDSSTDTITIFKNSDTRQIPDITLNTSKESIITCTHACLSCQSELNENKDKMVKYEDQIKMLNSNITKIQFEKSNLQEENDTLSNQHMEYVYENDKLTKNLEDMIIAKKDLENLVQSYELKLAKVNNNSSQKYDLSTAKFSAKVEVDSVDQSFTMEGSRDDTESHKDDLLKKFSDEIDRLKEKEVSVSSENIRLIEDLTELKLAIDQRERDNTTLKLEVDSLNAKLSKSKPSANANDQSFKSADSTDNIENSSTISHQICTSIIDELLEKVCSTEGSLQESSLHNVVESDSGEKRHVELSSSEIFIRELADKNEIVSINFKTLEKLNLSLGDQVEQLKMDKKCLESELEMNKLVSIRYETENDELNEKIKQWEEGCRALELQVKDLQRNLSQVKIENENMLASYQPKKLADLESSVAVMQNKIADLQTLNKNLQEQTIDFERIKEHGESIEKDRNGLNDKIINLEDILQQKNIALNDHEKSIETFKTRCDDMQTKIAMLESSNHAMCGDNVILTNLKREINEQNDWIGNAKRELEEKEVEIKELKSRIEVESQTYNLLKEQCDGTTSKFIEQSEKNVELEKLLEIVKVEKKQIFNERNEYEEKNKKLYQQLDSFGNCENKIHGLEIENKKIKENCNNLQVKIDDLQEKNLNLIETMSTIKKEKAQLNESLVDIKSKITVLEKSNNEFEQNVGKLSSELVDINQINNELKKNIQMLLDEKKELEKQILESKKENSELTSELNESRTILQNMEHECHSLKKSVSGLAENLEHLQETRNSLVEEKNQLEKEFKRKVIEECEQTQAELTNVRSKNLVISDKMEVLEREREVLEREKNDLQLLLNKNVSYTKEVERKLKLLSEKAGITEQTLKSFEEVKERLSAAKSECNNMILEKEDLSRKIKQYEIELAEANHEINRLSKQHKEQFEKATLKVEKAKIELECQVEQYNRFRNENEVMKIEVSSKDSEIRDLYSRLELMASNKDKNNTTTESMASKEYEVNGWVKDIETEFQSLQEEHSKCLNLTKEKEELLKQLHEMQKMHVYKMKQYQQEIHNLRSELKSKTDQDQNERKTKPVPDADYYNRLIQSADNNEMRLNESERQQLIKSLIGENDELRKKNENLTVELQESRTIAQKDRKLKRHSTHDEKRPLLWNENREIGTMTQPTDKLCNCERLDKELSEVKKTLRIRDIQIKTLMMESKHNPLKEEHEALKRSIEEDEAEKKELRKELCKLKNKITELYTESKKCDQCLRRSMTVFVNQCSQTTLSNEQSNGTNNAKLESEYLKIQSKYEDLKRLCRLRNSRIQDLESKLSKEKENETNNRQGRNNTTAEGTIESLSKELSLLRKKYEEARVICLYREKHIQSLEADLAKNKNGS